MTNIVLITKNRERLLRQCLESLYANTPLDQFRLTIVDDGSGGAATSAILEWWALEKNKPQVVKLYDSIGIVGWLRNTGASASERYFGRGEWLMFLDCDTAVFPNWLQKMTMVAETGPLILGGCRHPFHGVEMEHKMGRYGWQATDAVAGYSMMMSWATFDRYGPFADNQKGVGASEDWALCRKVVENGSSVGYIHPPVLAHTGITNTDGKPATGADSFRRVEGILYE